MLAYVAVLWLAVVPCQGASIDGRYQPKFEYDSGENGHEYISFNYGSNGVYKFAYQLRDQSRFEERDQDGEVRGAFSFIDPEGEQFSLQYLANKRGFQPTADHLPKAPEETEDVKEAREAFRTFYEETVKYLEALSSSEAEAGRREYERRFGRILENEEEEEDSSSEEEEEEEDEASSEEDDDDEESSEDDEEESDEDDEDSSEEEEGEEEEGEEEEGGEEGESETGNEEKEGDTEKSGGQEKNGETQSERRRSDSRRKSETKRKIPSKSEKQRSRGRGKYKA